jgi:hypothetical protein
MQIDVAKLSKKDLELLSKNMPAGSLVRPTSGKYTKDSFGYPSEMTASIGRTLKVREVEAAMSSIRVHAGGWNWDIRDLEPVVDKKMQTILAKENRKTHKFDESELSF